MSKKSKSNQEVTGDPPDSKQGRKAPQGKDWLGDNLRELYGSIAQEPIPDEFQDLLDKLEQSSGEKKPEA